MYLNKASVVYHLSFFLEYARDLRIIILRRNNLQYNQHAASALGGRHLDRPSKEFCGPILHIESTKKRLTSRPTNPPEEPARLSIERWE